MTVLPNPARMYTLGLDTIAGAKLLQLKFGASGAFRPDEAVIHDDRRARFIRISEGAAIIRHWGDSHPVAVPPETLSLPPARRPDRAVRVTPSPPRRVVRARVGWLPHHHPRGRQPLRP